MLGCAARFLCPSQDAAQSLSYDDFFAGLNGHRNQFDVVGFRSLFAGRIGPALANRRYQARIIRTENLDDRVARPQSAHAVIDGKAPRPLIPGDVQRGIAVAIVWNVYARFY